MKNLITICAFLMFVSNNFVEASTFTDGGIKYTTTSATTAEVTANSPLYSGDMTIPSTVVSSSVTYNITSIGNLAFSSCSNLTSLAIPNSVKSIGLNAFYGCTKMTTIAIPSSVTAIANGTFYGCSGLISINLPNSVISIGDNAFSSCKALSSVTLPSSLTSIGLSAFVDCSSLSSITIPSTVTSIGYQAFQICTSLTSINIAVDNANYSNTEDGVVFNKDKTTIAFYPGGKQGGYTLPSSVTSIGNYAFSSCNGLTSLNIPSTVRSIGNFAFSSCTGLTSLVLPSSISLIGNSTFSYCTGLSTITFPNFMSAIGNSAFSGTVWYTNQPDASVVYAGNVAYGYKGNMPMKTTLVINSGTTVINANAFLESFGLISITLPSSVTSIGDMAFSVTSLKSITLLSSTPLTLGKSSFAGLMMPVTDVYVPNDVAVANYQANAAWMAAFPGTIIKKNPTSALPSLGSNKVKVYVAGSEIVIEGLRDGACAALYNSNGQRLQSCKAQGDRLAFSVQVHAVYLVKVEGESFKLIF